MKILKIIGFCVSERKMGGDVCMLTVYSIHDTQDFPDIQIWTKSKTKSPIQKGEVTSRETFKCLILNKSV